MTITPEQIRRAKLRLLAKPFVAEVVRATGLSLAMPDKLFDAIPEGQEKEFMKILEEFGLEKEPNGYWHYSR